MITTIEVLFSPAELASLPGRDLSATVCVVFDVLRATSSMIAALAQGAAGIIPAGDIPEALALHSKHSESLLAGERHGLRVAAALTGGVQFDFGNSPREFTAERIQGRLIIMTTTNGTRALRECASALAVLPAAFLNLGATAQRLRRMRPRHLLLIGSGTHEEAAFEDTLGCGALADLLLADRDEFEATDSAEIARRVHQREPADTTRLAACSRNARRLLGIPELRDDVAWCLQTDLLPCVARMGGNGVVTRWP